MPEVVGQHTVAAFSTPIRGGPLDADVTRGNDNNLRTPYIAHDADPGIHLQGSHIDDLPAAGTAGRKWVTWDDDDRYQLWRDDGVVWQEVTSTTFPTDNGQPELFDAGNSGAALEIDWLDGPVQKVTLTDAATLTFVNPVAGATYTLILVQDAAGGRTVTLTGWDFGDNLPVYNTATVKKNVVSGLYDGSEYLAALGVQGA